MRLCVRLFFLGGTGDLLDSIESCCCCEIEETNEDSRKSPGNSPVSNHIYLFIFSNKVNIPSLFLFDRFWKMASTVTGLKLQGLMGHFGKNTVTDIEGYVEFPDGKVCVLLCLQVGFLYKKVS